jgi:hypothetical protein
MVGMGGELEIDEWRFGSPINALSAACKSEGTICAYAHPKALVPEQAVA